MTTLEDDDDLTDASSPDASAEDDDAVDHDPNDTLVDVPDAEIVGDAVEMDGNDDIDLLTDGPYAPPEEPMPTSRPIWWSRRRPPSPPAGNTGRR